MFLKIVLYQLYKIDNKYQKANIKILEYRLDFQKYNIKEKKKKKQSHKYIYMNFAFKK